MRKICLIHACILFLLLHIHISHSTVEKNGLKIGAFNIQVFGASKIEKTAVVQVLVDIISQYDLVLIQEIRESSGAAIEEFLNKTNQHNLRNPFSMIISPRLGRSRSKEQYAFLYREQSGLKLGREYVYFDVDETLNTDMNTFDIFEREPYIALFESSATKLKRFAVAGLHIAPSEAVKELQALEDVFDDIKEKLDIDDIMLMGDLNAGCSYVPNYSWETIPIRNNPLYTWWIGDDVDTTVGNSDCPYDRFISTGRGLKTGVVNGSATVFRFDSVFQLNQTFSLKVSDHYPIEFVLVHDLQTSDAYKSRTSVFFACILQCTFISIYIL